VTVPALTPVTRPALVTVATPVLLLPHVPPLFGVTLAVNPTHTLVAPPRTGFAGIALMIALPDDTEVHPLEPVTVKV
jgi:hypothetical protein